MTSSDKDKGPARHLKPKQAGKVEKSARFVADSLGIVQSAPYGELVQPVVEGIARSTESARLTHNAEAEIGHQLANAKGPEYEGRHRAEQDHSPPRVRAWERSEPKHSKQAEIDK